MWQESVRTRATQMTRMPSLKLLSSLFQNQRSLRHRCVIGSSPRKKVPPPCMSLPPNLKVSKDREETKARCRKKGIFGECALVQFCAASSFCFVPSFRFFGGSGNIRQNDPVRNHPFSQSRKAGHIKAGRWIFEISDSNPTRGKCGKCGKPLSPRKTRV